MRILPLVLALAPAVAVAIDGRSSDADWSDAEIRRFALDRGGFDHLLPREYFVSSQPGTCPATVPDLAAARALAEERKRFYGREHGVEIGTIEDDPRAYRVPFPGRESHTPAYRILRSDFYRCVSDHRRTAGRPTVVGYLTRPAAVEDVAWLARAFWEEGHESASARLLEERIDEDREGITVDRVTTVYERHPWDPSAPIGIQVRRWRLSVASADGAVTLDDRLERTIALACPAAEQPSHASRFGTVSLVAEAAPDDGGLEAAPAILLWLVNDGPEDLTASFSTECPPVSLLVYDASGRDVTPRRGYGCIPEGPEYRVRAGARERVGVFRWPPTSAKGEPELPPGTYTVKGTIPAWGCGSVSYPPMVSAPAEARIPSTAAAAAIDERSSDDLVRRLVLGSASSAILDPGASEWLGQGAGLLSDSRSQRSIQIAASGPKSARAAVELDDVVVRGHRVTPEAYIFGGTRQGYPVTRAVWRADFYRPTRAFRPAFAAPVGVSGRRASPAPVARAETGVLARTPDRKSAARLAALLWAQDYKEGQPPGRLVSERVTEDDDAVHVARFTVGGDPGPRWKVTVWEWTLVADKRTRTVRRSVSLLREIAPGCPPLATPAPGRTAEGLRIDVAIEPRVATPVFDRVSTTPPPPAGAIIVTLSNPTSEDVYLTSGDDVLGYRVSRADGTPVRTPYDTTITVAERVDVRVPAQSYVERRFAWVGRLDARTALPAGRFRVQGLATARSCGPHRLAEELSAPLEFEVLPAVGQP
jgi:hypothetical protein